MTTYRCVRLLSVCVRGVSERYLSAWWSTLGGAYSALGDINTMHVCLLCVCVCVP